MKTAFCIPTTSRGLDIKDITESPLFQVVLRTLKIDSLGHHLKDVQFYIGYDFDDPIFNNQEQRDKLKDYNISWLSVNVEKGHVTEIWNRLGRKAIEDGFEYLYILGDDILFENKPFLDKWIMKLKKQNNLGWVAGFSGNNRIPTQFFIHKTHYDIFNYIYHPMIKNWWCDDFMNELYPQKYRQWDKDTQHLNVGGEPRYEIKDAQKLYKMLIQREKKKYYSYVNACKNKNVSTHI